MTRLIRTELLKQRTVRTFVAGVAAAPAVAALVAVAVFDAAGESGNDPLGADSFVQVVGAPTSVVTLVALFLGLLSMAGEYRHETVTTTFLATPRRRDVVLAKLAASTLLGALTGLLSVAATVAVAVPWLRSAGVPVDVDGDVLAVAAGLVLATALYGAHGVSVGALLRSQTAAVTVVLVWLLAAEGIAGDVLGSGVGRWLPASAGRAVVAGARTSGALDPVLAAAVFAAYVVVFAAAATRLTLRRDVT